MKKILMMILILVLSPQVGKAGLKSPYHTSKTAKLEEVRLSIDSHPTEVEQGVEIFSPLAGLQEMNHQHSFSYLRELEPSEESRLPLSLKRIGISYSGHQTDKESYGQKYSLHFVFVQKGVTIGATGYVGKYQGMDLDLNPAMPVRWLNLYLNCRNFGEVWDAKAKITPWKHFEVVAEQNDQTSSCKAYFNFPLEGLNMKIGIGEKEFYFGFSDEAAPVNFLLSMREMEAGIFIPAYASMKIKF